MTAMPSQLRDSCYEMLVFGGKTCHDSNWKTVEGFH